jgi:predicted Fe-S protein YdhL (DUF1289 family)
MNNTCNSCGSKARYMCAGCAETHAKRADWGRIMNISAGEEEGIRPSFIKSCESLKRGEIAFGKQDRDG